jgi:HAD superfamily hydrolase (TIGR01509 family)
MSALLFGSISTLADTSEQQREAFNDAFAAHGLDWTWERDDYVAMLAANGGRDRVSAYAESRGESVDAEAVHQTKSELFRARLAADGATPRPGVVETIEAARGRGFKVGLVTTTSADNVAALTQSLAGAGVDGFDLIVDSSSVEPAKPDPAAYAFALDRLGESAADCLAIEDNLGGVRSATSAGITCVAFPNANTVGQGFEQAITTVARLDFAELAELQG